MLLTTPVSVGEVFDKITILKIKQDLITCPKKGSHVENELQMLNGLIETKVEMSEPLKQLITKLKEINLTLWKIEDQIRLYEKDRNFGDEFIQLARSIYMNNDKRAALKLEINKLLGSTLVEVKSYENYSD